MTTSTIAIIGCGNMGTSLLGGLIASGYAAKNLWVTNPTPHKLERLAQQFGVHTTADNKQAVQAADVVIFAVKPQVLGNVISEVASLIQHKKKLVISIVSGIRETTLQQWLGGNCAIIRCMPNTPAMVGCGASGLFANSLTSQTERDLAETILRAVGIVVWLKEEKLMDTVTALSGSGPAYFFLFMEILQHAGETLGLPNDIARLLTLQTCLGAARMALESPESLTELRQRVTSPNGTTHAAIQLLEQQHIRRTLTAALQAARDRAAELATQLAATELKNA